MRGYKEASLLYDCSSASVRSSSLSLNAVVDRCDGGKQVGDVS